MEEKDGGLRSGKEVIKTCVWPQEEEINNIGCFSLGGRRQRSARGRNLRTRGLVWKRMWSVLR